MVAKVAEAKGIRVDVENDSNLAIKLQEPGGDNCSVDYLVCSSDLHPADINSLIKKLHRGMCFREALLTNQNIIVVLYKDCRKQ